MIAVTAFHYFIVAYPISATQAPHRFSIGVDTGLHILQKSLKYSFSLKSLDIFLSLSLRMSSGLSSILVNSMQLLGGMNAVLN